MRSSGLSTSGENNGSVLSVIAELMGERSYEPSPLVPRTLLVRDACEGYRDAETLQDATQQPVDAVGCSGDCVWGEETMTEDSGHTHLSAGIQHSLDQRGEELQFEDIPVGASVTVWTTHTEYILTMTHPYEKGMKRQATIQGGRFVEPTEAWLAGASAGSLIKAGCIIVGWEMEIYLPKWHGGKTLTTSIVRKFERRTR